MFFVLFKIYQKHDVLIMTSLHEGFPISIMEAMSAGCAILSTPVGDIPYHVKHEQNGFLGTKWKDQSTRWNQLRLLNEVSINKELLHNDGLSDLDFVQHGLMRDNKTYHAIIGI